MAVNTQKRKTTVMCVWTEERKYALKIDTHNTLSEPESEYSVTAGTGEHVKHMGRQPA